MRYIGEYPEALLSLDRSEREFRQLLVPSIELGNTAYIRGVVLTYMDRLDEAERFAAGSAEIFDAFRDSERWVLATAAQAAILYYRSDYESALALFERLLKLAEANSDTMETARHSSNVGVCCIQIGNAARAAECLLVAHQLFVELENKPELVRIERWLGVLSRVGGNVADSIARLRSARNDFDRLGLLYDAALATIDLVESLLVAGQTGEIPKLCADAMRFIRRAGNRRQAFIAAAYLKEAANRRELTLRRVEHVRKFVHRLEARPSLHFEPPVD
ncbi:MAG TPA: tetratricopeptide repeat protein [Thermoanaerobaculia bacterium]|nr:tetratricopeptide repeat protein [Thermoanaerobaculia bacterium]